MQPQAPVIEGYEEREQVIAAPDDTCQPLSAIVCKDEHGTVIHRWQMDDAERAEFLRTGNLYLAQLTRGRGVQPLQPFAFPPDVPDDLPEAAAAAAPPPEFFVEYRIVPLHRRTGEPMTSIEAGAGVFVNITSLAQAMNCVMPPVSDDPDELMRSVVNLHAQLLSEMYGADVYFRPLGSKSDRWIVREGVLENGATRNRKEHPAPVQLSGVIEVCVIDSGDTATVPEALGMMRALRERFKPPYYLAGFSTPEDYEQVNRIGEAMAERVNGSIEEVVRFFRETFRPKGDYCLHVYAGAERTHDFLLDTRIFEKTRSN